MFIFLLDISSLYMDTHILSFLISCIYGMVGYTISWFLLLLTVRSPLPKETKCHQLRFDRFVGMAQDL